MLNIFPALKGEDNHEVWTIQMAVTRQRRKSKGAAWFSPCRISISGICQFEGLSRPPPSSRSATGPTVRLYARTTFSFAGTCQGAQVASTLQRAFFTGVNALGSGTKTR